MDRRTKTLRGCLLLAALSAFACRVSAVGGAPTEEASHSAPPVQGDVAQIVRDNTAFACDLYAKLRSANGNLIYSPYSTSIALAMTYAGASGETERQMRAVLRFTPPPERVHPAFRNLVKGMDPKDCALRVANRLWGQTGYTFLPRFLQLTEREYAAQLQPLDFAQDPDAARRTINTWVEQKTGEKIRDLLQPGDVAPLTTLVLTNAIYFKGRWAQPFDKKDTRPAAFTLLDGSGVPTEMMHRLSRFPVAETEKLQIVEIPYAGDTLSMMVLLPKKPRGLPELERSLSAASLAEWLQMLNTRAAHVYLPKFKVSSRFSLATTLASMGMPVAFAGAADFSGMTGKKELFISDVIHKAFTEVNEEGTEAAAATGVVMKRGRVFQIRADHPFLFLIRDRRSESLLFLGRVVDPRR